MKILPQPRHHQGYDHIHDSDHLSHSHGLDYDQEQSRHHGHTMNTVKKFVSKLKKAVAKGSHSSSHESNAVRRPENQATLGTIVASHGHSSSNMPHGWVPRLISSCTYPSYSDSHSFRASETNCNITPEGFLAVYAGRERKRFLIPASYLNHPAFRLLLEKSKEVFGFSQKGALNLPFELCPFERLLWLIGHGDPPPSNDLGLQELEQFYRERYRLSIEILHDFE
jgi:hypothetical protein